MAKATPTATPSVIVLDPAKILGGTTDLTGSIAAGTKPLPAPAGSGTRA